MATKKKGKKKSAKPKSAKPKRSTRGKVARAKKPVRTKKTLKKQANSTVRLPLSRFNDQIFLAANR